METEVPIRRAITRASREEAIRALAGIEAELARRDLKAFARRVWHLVEPDRPMLWNWHLDIVASALCDVTAGRTHRLIINIPPGCMKSLLVSVIWPAWEWASMPGLRCLTASYGAQLSIRDNLRLRDIVSSPWFRDSYGVRLMGDQNAKERFMNTDGGWRIATSVGGVGTGEHPDRIIIDDPHTAQQARSSTERQTALDWFRRTVSSRGVARERAIVIIMQRLHQDDLAGHLLKTGDWKHVCLPMRWEEKGANPLDPRRKTGELLWPELFPEKAIRQLELDLGPYGAASQLQQRPAPEGGGLFKRSWFKVVDELPKVPAPLCRGWDTAGTAGGGDWTVGVKIMGPVNGIWYICDVARGQWSPAEVEEVMFQTALMDGIHVRQREEKEPGSAGQAVIAARQRGRMARFDYSGVPISGDKVTRSMPFRAQVEAGNVCLLRAPWNEAYLSELEQFPVGDHDDQADGSSCAYNELAAGPRPVRQVGVTWG